MTLSMLPLLLLFVPSGCSNILDVGRMGVVCQKVDDVITYSNFAAGIAAFRANAATVNA